MANQDKHPGRGAPRGISRRTVLASSVGPALIPLAACRTSSPPTQESVLAPEARQVLEAFTDRIIPADENGPGALAAGVPDYIEHSLAHWNRAEGDSLEAGLRALNHAALERYHQDFALLPAADRDALMADMEDGRLANFDNAPQIFNRLHRLSLEGMFCDPYYGGNRNYLGWDLIGYPGAVMASTAAMQRMGARLPPLHTSAYGSDYDGH